MISHSSRPVFSRPVALRLTHRALRSALRFALLALAFAPALISVAHAQSALPPLPPAPANQPLPEAPDVDQAAFLINEAFAVATRTAAARPIAVKTAASLVPRLAESSRDVGREQLTQRWFNYAQSNNVSRTARADAYASFFDAASKADADYATRWAMKTPDAAARAGALLAISRALPDAQWSRADSLVADAARAARGENDPLRRTRALVYVADRATEFSPARALGSIAEARREIATLNDASDRDNLTAELIPAVSRYDVNLARDLVNSIGDADLKNLAGARVNLAEASLSSVTTRTKDRVQLLATAAAPYDNRALPFLVKLPPDPSVLKAISETLPPIYASARPAIDVARLESLWTYSQKAPEGVYRDQLQSRLARLMVTQDLWRGRDWGKQLAWKGGRIQVGAFLKDVLANRSSQLKVASLQDVAQGDVNAALSQARTLAPVERTEALLLLAGQILN